jgi:hypothetical protein
LELKWKCDSSATCIHPRWELLLHMQVGLRIIKSHLDCGFLNLSFFEELTVMIYTKFVEFGW